MNKIEYKKMTNTTPITADTFNDIWNAIDCIDYRLRNEEQMRKKQSIKLILAFILFELLIIGITILLCKG